MDKKVFIFKLVVAPDEGMNMDTADIVKDLIEEAIRSSGMDNGASIDITLISDSEV